MAKIRLGPLVSDISGSIGPMVFRRNNSGMTVQAKPTKSGSLSVNQRASSSLLAKVARAWPGRSARDLRSWENWALQHPQKSALGRQRVSSAYAVYCARELASQWCFPYDISTRITREPVDATTLIRVVQEPLTAHLSLRIYFAEVSAYYAVWCRLGTSILGPPARRQWTQLVGYNLYPSAFLYAGSDEYGNYREPHNNDMDAWFTSLVREPGYAWFKVIVEIERGTYARRTIGPITVVPVV